MARGRFLVRGELYLSLETVADCYSIEVAWLEECAAFGLFELASLDEHTRALSGAALERVAEILRLRASSGLELPALALWLEE